MRIVVASYADVPLDSALCGHCDLMTLKGKIYASPLVSGRGIKQTNREPIEFRRTARWRTDQN